MEHTAGGPFDAFVGGPPITTGVFIGNGRTASSIVLGTSPDPAFRGEGGDLTPVFAANRMAPGGDTFEDFSSPVINRHGQVATVAKLSGASRRGLFISDGTDAVAIALQGQPAPKGGTYGKENPFRGAIRLNF